MDDKSSAENTVIEATVLNESVPIIEVTPKEEKVDSPPLPVDANDTQATAESEPNDSTPPIKIEKSENGANGDEIKPDPEELPAPALVVENNSTVTEDAEDAIADVQPSISSTGATQFEPTSPNCTATPPLPMSPPPSSLPLPPSSSPKPTTSTASVDVTNVPNVEIKQENEKRSRSETGWSSDEEFAGFDDCNGGIQGGKNARRKKVKEEPVSDVESHGYDETITPPIKLENPEIKSEENVPEENMEVESSSTSTVTTKTITQNVSKHTLNKRQRVYSPNTPVANHRKPFEFGWKREIIHKTIITDEKRATEQRKTDIVYITPNGKRVRSRTELQAHLHDGIAANMFLFTRDPIGMGPTEEIVRTVKTVAPPSRRSNFLDLGEPDPSLGFGKRIPKPKMPKGASPPPPSSLAKEKPKATVTPIAKRSEGSESESQTKSTTKITKTSKAKISSTASSATTAATAAAAALTTGEDLSPPFKKRLLNRSTSKPQTPTQTLSGITPISPKNVGTAAGLTVGAASASADKKTLTTSNVSPSVHKLFAANFFNNVSLGYDVLMHTFQYLKVQELLRASCVCRMWNQVANNHNLWRTIRMKNSQVNDWSGLANTLKSNGTRHLDLRKMLIQNNETTWHNFCEHIGEVTQLESIDFCRCSSAVVEHLAESNPRLQVINAVSIKDEHLRISGFHRLQQLTELRLKSLNTMNIDSLSSLRALKYLKHLSLTSIKDLGKKNIEVLGHLSKLESLELGECSELSADFSMDVLSNLSVLERLRLEKGQDNNLFDILNTIANMPQMVHLELVNFDIKTGFDTHLKRCINLKRLLLIPTYISQSATTNHMVLQGILDLGGSLEQLTWVVTLELLRVTELYVDQYNCKRKEVKHEDKIPILKPIPGMSEEELKLRNTPKTMSDAPQVEIIPLTSVESILASKMPKTKCSILKVPFLATWKQNMVAELQ